jgi:hypothetical protein
MMCLAPANAGFYHMAFIIQNMTFWNAHSLKMISSGAAALAARTGAMATPTSPVALATPTKVLQVTRQQARA